MDHSKSTCVGNEDRCGWPRISSGPDKDKGWAKKSDLSIFVASLLCNGGLLIAQSKTAKNSKILLFLLRSYGKLNHFKRQRDLVRLTFVGHTTRQINKLNMKHLSFPIVKLNLAMAIFNLGCLKRQTHPITLNSILWDHPCPRQRIEVWHLGVFSYDPTEDCVVIWSAVSHLFVNLLAWYCMVWQLADGVVWYCMIVYPTYSWTC